MTCGPASVVFESEDDQRADVLEVVGHDVGHVYITRAAADVLAPAGRSNSAPSRGARREAPSEQSIAAVAPVVKEPEIACQAAPRRVMHRPTGAFGPVHLENVR